MSKNDTINTTQVVVDVDTLLLTHHAGVIDTDRKRVGDRAFPIDTAGYRDLFG